MQGFCLLVIQFPVFWVGFLKLTRRLLAKNSPDEKKYFPLKKQIFSRQTVEFLNHISYFYSFFTGTIGIIGGVIILLRTTKKARVCFWRNLKKERRTSVGRYGIATRRKRG
tara:strand:+ start:2831 stop:3163 length:333 start_codon:yes stop_codon:yes gene_type:complete